MVHEKLHYFFIKILDMTESELGHLARHLGHDPKTHRDYYRLSHSTIQLSTVSTPKFFFSFYILFCSDYQLISLLEIGDIFLFNVFLLIEIYMCASLCL